MSPADQLDAIIIGGDVPDEYLGKDVRERLRLTVDGYPASLRFLAEYFGHARNADSAQAALQEQGLPFVPLNSHYLNAYLTARGLHTEMLTLLSPNQERFVELLHRRPRAVVISTTFLPFARHIDSIAAKIKQIAPQTLVIAGGTQVWKSYRHKQMLDAGTMDESIRVAVSEHNFFTDPTRGSPVDVFVVSAAGEASLAALLTRIQAGADYRDLPNLAMHTGGHWVFTPQQDEPFREVEVDWSQAEIPAARTYIPIQAGTGCGFQCEFCDFRGLRPTRLRSAASIINEIRSIIPTDGLRRIYFTDDNLFTSRKRAREICRALLDSGMRVRWRGMVRIDIVDSEMAELMAASGCLEVLLGIESGDPTILQNMGKSVTPEQVISGVQQLSRAGINSKSTFIVGFPGETELTLARTVELLNAYPTDELSVHRYLFFRFGVLPLSRVASQESRARYGLQGYGYDWSHNTMTSTEAEQLMTTIDDRLKVELYPSYILEVPEIPGMSRAKLKQAVMLRNQLARWRRGQPAADQESVLWDRLEHCF